MGFIPLGLSNLISEVFREQPVGMVSMFVPDCVVTWERVLLHDNMNACSFVEEIMNLPMDAAILGKWPVYSMNLHCSYIFVVSKSIRLTLQSQKSVSIRPTGPGQMPWVSEYVHLFGFILSMKYLSSADKMTVESLGISTVSAVPLFGIGKTGNGSTV